MVTSREGHREIYLRTILEMLKRILELDLSSLVVKRLPDKRRASLCRDFAVLLVSMLRHQSVPARVRVGFVGYYRAETLRYQDHRIAEYWNEGLNYWVLVDAMTEERAPRKMQTDAMRKKMRALFGLSRIRVCGLSANKRLQRTIISN